MSFTLQLTPDLVSVEPGASVPVSILVQNQGDARERFELEIEGIDPEWKAVPVPVFEADAAGSKTERFFFKPPRASESVAGDYPFVVRVRSLETGDAQIAQGVLQVKPFHHLSMEVSPKRGTVSPIHRSASFEVTVMNLGNSEHTVRLLAGDAEEECAYELESEQVTVSPGAQRQVEITVSPKRSPWFTSGRLVGISLSARSLDTPSVVSTSQAQLEQRPILSIPTLAVAVIVVIVFSAWFLARPKPIVLDVWPDHDSVTAGKPVTVRWHMVGANRILIKTQADEIYSGAELDGSATYTPSTEGPLKIETVATQDGGDEKRKSIVIDVIPAPAVDKPEISRLSVNHRSLNNGDSFVLTYAFGPSVTRAILSPDNTSLDLALTEQLVKPTSIGVNKYTVVAFNSKGETTSKSFTVNVVDKSDAHIVVFEVSPKQASPDSNKVTLSWQVSEAARVELIQDEAAPVTELSTDKQDFVLTAPTVFKLVAIDSQGREVSQSIAVPFVTPKPMPANPSPTTAGDTGTIVPTTTGSPPPTSTPPTTTTGGHFIP